MNRFLLFFICLIGLTACKSTLLPEKPAVSYQSFSYTPEPSLINLPVEIKVAELETFLNKQLAGLIYEDNSLDDNGGDNLMVKAWKKYNIRLNFENGKFNYTVPLKLWIKAGWKVEKFGISLSDYREVNAEISLDFHTSVTVNKDWSVTTTTASDGYHWISKPVLKLGPIDLPITFIADLIIKYNMGTISSAIDEGMKTSLDLKSNAQQAWTEIQKPVLLDGEYKLWMKITPKTISASQITGNKGVLKHTTSIQAVAECFTGSEPSGTTNIKLPDIQPLPKSMEGFLMNVTSYISYNYIDSISKANLNNTSYSVGRKKITITGVKVYPGSDKLIVETDITGSLNGKLFFAGKPEYRISDSTLMVSDLNFHIQTKNLLVRSASWLVNGGIERIIARKMVYPLGEELKLTYDLIQDNLKHYDLGYGFFLTGQLSGMEVHQPVLSKDAIIAPVTFEGKLTMSLKNN